ncbi:SDR family oxidoreductase [Candidatus Puniceispirillum sp.]|uniref:SDR family oxidoreductase n=1 Tax=Candidatus Puniceispirillum sp. TaxID=2026719 RepID=UPI001ED3B87C|nr:SDR family oxidoreductase [Candidatus Puniceispirillum sp.]
MTQSDSGQSNNKTSLTGKRAIITGGSRGIGLAIAKKLALSGADIMILGSNAKNLAQAKDNIAGTVATHAADLRTLEGCESAFAAYQSHYDTCDIFVHSAGATKGGVFPAQSDDDFIDGFALKFHAGVRMSRLFWPMLKAAHGTAIMIIGGASRTPDAGFMVGGAVNAALANYTKALAGQGNMDDVNVNWINPGQTETERLQMLLETRARDEGKAVDDVRAERMQAEGIRRLGQPDDVASLVHYLCQDEARHIQGTGISVDGGATKGYF